MAQCVLFFLAGQETTSSVISFAAYLLAVNPDIQARLREEVDECFENEVCKALGLRLFNV